MRFPGPMVHEGVLPPPVSAPLDGPPTSYAARAVTKNQGFTAHLQPSSLNLGVNFQTPFPPLTGVLNTLAQRLVGPSAPLIKIFQSPAPLPDNVLFGSSEPELGPYLPGFEPASTIFRTFRKVLDYRHYCLRNTNGILTEQDLNKMHKMKKNIYG